MVAAEEVLGVRNTTPVGYSCSLSGVGQVDVSDLVDFLRFDTTAVYLVQVISRQCDNHVDAVVVKQESGINARPRGVCAVGIGILLRVVIAVLDYIKQELRLSAVADSFDSRQRHCAEETTVV